MKNNKTYLDDSHLTSPVIHENPYRKNSRPKKIIKEKSSQNMRFNVMKNRYVNEEVKIKEYRLWDNAIEVLFDRTYQTEMINSPDHLTFLSSLINLQKMVYVFMHSYLSIEYNHKKNEALKVWPGKLSIDMPKMIFKKENISHLMIIKSIQKIKTNRYKMHAITKVDGIVEISGDALIVVL